MTKSGFGKRSNRPSFNIAAAPPFALFRRLSDQHQRAVPLLAMIDHPFRGAAPRGHVQVVTAGVHDGDRRTGEVLRDHGARERNACLLRHGQRIELGPKHHRRASTVSQETHDAGAADAGRHLVSKRLETRGKLRGGLHLLEGQLRIAMDVLIERLQFGIVGVNICGGLTADWRRGKQRDCETELMDSLHCQSLLILATSRPRS